MKPWTILKNLLCCIPVLILPAIYSCNSDSQHDVSEKAGNATISKMAEFKGDVYEYIATHTVYPSQSVANKKEGNVLVYFNIDESGLLSDIETVSGGTDPKLVQAALDCMADMPAWNPAEQNGKKVKSKSHLIFPFRLSPDRTNIGEELTDEEFEQGLAKMQEDLAEMRKNRQSETKIETTVEDQKKLINKVGKILREQANMQSNKYITPGSAQKG